jgi:hypothetical protein
MDVAYISALAALAGSIIGGLTTGLTTWLNQRAQAKAGHLAHELSRREALYKDFIIAASKVYGDAMVSDEPRIQELIDLYAMISRMRVMSSARTIASAEQIMLTTLDTYFAPNKTIRDLREMMRSGTGIDPLRDFSEAAREELMALSPLLDSVALRPA